MSLILKKNNDRSQGQTTTKHANHNDMKYPKKFWAETKELSQKLR